MQLKDLPSSYLEIALKTNPTAAMFPWGPGYSRKEIEAELESRIVPDTAAQQRAILAAIRRQGEEAMCKIWNPYESEPAEPFRPAGPEQDKITVLIFTSPVPSHPSTRLLENVFNSVRAHLSSARIIILADGCDGPEPEAYTQFKNAAASKGWEVVGFTGHHHQTLMLKYALLTPNLVTTELVFITEHDWGVKPLFINWHGIVETLAAPIRKVNLIQIRQERISTIEHDNCFSEAAMDVNGIKLLPTACFQCPSHVARVDWYREQVRELRIPDFLERDELRAALVRSGGIHEMAAYIPMGFVSRLYHLNGRWIK